MRSLLRVILGVIVGVLLPSATMAEQAESERPASLLIYPRSENVGYHYKSTNKSGVCWVYYAVQVAYPAEDVLQFIRDGLEHQGWQPLNEDVLNPGLPSSHVTGWYDFIDATTSPKTHVYQWLAQWKDAQGDVVWYTLRYRHPIGSSPMPNIVRVNATYFPAEVVDRATKPK